MGRRGSLLRPVEAGPRDHALAGPRDDRRAVRYRLSSEACRYDLSPRLWRIARSQEEPMSLLRRRDGPRIKYVAEDAGPYDTITVDKLTPIIGAEIGGVDLAQPLGNRMIDELHRALAENSVIFFRDQHLSDEQHLAFGRLFGDLHLHPPAPSEPGMPEVMIIYADKDSP